MNIEKTGMADRKVVVLAAHPDDADLAVGGTIAMLSELGTEVTVINFTTSEYTTEGVQNRRVAAEKASQILGYRLLWIEDGRYNQVEEIAEYHVVSIVDKIIGELCPDVVITHWIGDSHTDHVRLARAVIASSRRWEASLYAFGPTEHRTPCFTQFEPNVFVDITGYEERKLAAINAFNYSGQGFRHLQLDMVRTTFTYNGGLIGRTSAEALLLVRQRGLGITFIGD